MGGYKKKRAEKGLHTVSTSELEETLWKRKKDKGNRFPLHVFHESVHRFMNTLVDKYKIPPSFVGTAMLSANSTAIGTAYVVKTGRDDKIYLPMYAGLVGESSSGKSEAIDKCYGPLMAIQREYSLKYREMQLSHSEEERKQGKVFEVIVRDARVPTLIKDSLTANLKGVAKLHGEIIEWINGMDPGSRKEGTDEQFWITTWDCDPYQKKLGNNQNFYVDHPFVNILGGVQYEVLPDIFGGKRAHSGFAYRILFAMPEWEDIAFRDFDADITEEEKKPHYDCINRLYHHLEVWEDYEPNTCILTPDAKKLHWDFFDDLRNKINKLPGDQRRAAKGFFGKLLKYAFRFAAILKLHFRACDKQYDRSRKGFLREEVIDVETMSRALELVEYFYRASMEVNEMVEGLIIAPPQVVAVAGMVKNGKSYRYMVKVVYENDPHYNENTNYDAYRKTLERLIKKWSRQYPKVFNARNF